MKRVRLGNVEFSVVDDENATDSVSITDNPVESGQDVSDHMKQEPSTIDITGIIVGDDAADKIRQLRKYQTDRVLVTYVGRNIYSNMGLLTFKRNHGKDIANGFAFDMALKQVRIATASQVEIKVANPVTKVASPQVKTKVKPPTNNGKQQTKSKATSSSDALYAEMGIYQGGLIGQQMKAPINNMKASNSVYKSGQLISMS